MLPEPEPYLNPATPDRPRDQHHTWSVGGKKYTLVFGDLHRAHGLLKLPLRQDGCVLEHSATPTTWAELDFMARRTTQTRTRNTILYEWGQTQRLVDVFYAPGEIHFALRFEREQPYPWVHRNVVFAHWRTDLSIIKPKLYEAVAVERALSGGSRRGTISADGVVGRARQIRQAGALIKPHRATAMEQMGQVRTD